MNNIDKTWIPSIAALTSITDSHAKRLKIACIAGNRLLAGLQYECELLLVTPQRAERIFKYCQPQCLIVDSSIFDAKLNVAIDKSNVNIIYDGLEKTLELSRKYEIDSIYWITQSNHQIPDWINKFDLVYCADTADVERLAAKGIRARILKPCTQPLRYKAFDYGRLNKNINILYESLPGYGACHSIQSQLERLLRFQLKIANCPDANLSNDAQIPVRLEAVTLGTVQPLFRSYLLECTNSYYTHFDQNSSSLEQQWRTLDAIAASALVVYHGQIHNDDVRKGAVIECGNVDEVMLEFFRQQKDSNYVKHVAYLGWKKICLEHTYSHRLGQILDDLMEVHALKTNLENIKIDVKQKMPDDDKNFDKLITKNNISSIKIPTYQSDLDVWKRFLSAQEIKFKMDRERNIFDRGWSV